jgi:hypothetical protein
MPDPLTVGGLVAAALAAGAVEAGKALLGQGAKDAYAALTAAAGRVLGPLAAALAGKPDSPDLAASVAVAVDAAPPEARSELGALAEALKAALPAEARTSIDNRVTIIASGANSIAGYNVNVNLPGKP